jgi:hypothetical protein
MPHTRHPGNLPQQLLTDPTEVVTSWVVSVDDTLLELTTDQLLTITSAGLFGPYRQITGFLPSPRNDVVLTGASSNLLGVGTLSMPGHAIGYLARARWFSGTAEEVYGLEARVDHEGAAAVIAQGTGVLIVTGTNSDNAGTMTLFEGVRFPDYSGVAYSRITNRVAFVNDDPGAMIVTRGRILGPYGRLRNALSKTTYSGGEIAPPMHGGMAAGVRYSSPQTLVAADLALGSTLIYYTPVHVPERVTLNQLGFRVTVAGAGGTVARMGVYPLVRGALGAKIAEAPEVSVATTGDKQSTVAGGIVLEAGMYMLALQSSGAPTVQWNTDYSLGGVLGTTNVDRNDTLVFSTPGSYGALPTTPTLTRAANSGWVVPNLWLTVA